MSNEAVVMKNVCKDFKVLNRHEGLKGSIQDLFSRDYKTVSAVKDVTLTVNRGEIIGYLGPNRGQIHYDQDDDRRPRTHQR